MIWFIDLIEFIDMNVSVKMVCAIILFPLLLGCNSGGDFVTDEILSPTKAPQSSDISNNTVVIYDELPKIKVSSETTLIASPSSSKSYLANAIVKPGESVYLVGRDKDNAWLLVLHMNTLGWIPSIISNTGTGVLDPTVIERSQLNNCTVYLGAVMTPNGTWESNINTRILVQGFMYNRLEKEYSGEIELTFQNEETGQEYPAQIDHIALESGNEVLVFTAIIDELQQGNHIKYHLSGLKKEIIPFQAAFFSEDCLNPFPNPQTTQAPQAEYTPKPPISTLVIRITSSVMPPTSVPESSEFANYSCPDKSQVKLRVGLRAIVSIYDINLRSSPKVPDVWDANIVVTLRQGDKMTVIGGPQCAHEGTWWEVQTDSGYTGWVRELQPNKVLLELIK